MNTMTNKRESHSYIYYMLAVVDLMDKIWKTTDGRFEVNSSHERERVCMCMFVGKNDKTKSHGNIFILSGLTYLQQCTAQGEPSPVKILLLRPDQSFITKPPANKYHASRHRP